MKETYKINLECSNCGSIGEYEIPKGRSYWNFKRDILPLPTYPPCPKCKSKCHKERV